MSDSRSDPRSYAEQYYANRDAQDKQTGIDPAWKNFKPGPQQAAAYFHLSGAPGREVGRDANEAAQNLRDDGHADSLAFTWNGQNGGAEKEAARLEQAAANRANRQAVMPNRDAANQYRGLQLAAANGYESMANGTGPSLANSMQTQAANAAQMQAGRVAGMNGGAGNARAAIMGLNGGLGAATSQAVGQRVNEYNTGVQGMAGQYGNMMSGDMNAATSDAQLRLGQREMNDAAAYGYDKMAAGVRDAEMQGQLARANMRLGTIESQRNYRQAMQNIANGEEEANQKAAADASSAGLSLMASDKRLKENVSDGSSDTRSMMDSLSPKSYSYKSGNGLPTDQRVGIMAQDMEKSKLGREAIVDVPIGGQSRKGVDVNKGLSLALAGMADLNSRLKKFEGK